MAKVNPVQSGYNDRGEEIPDPTPMEVPLKFRPAVGEVQRLKSLIREVISQHADEHEAETFEEANDFDVGEEDPLPLSAHEVAEDDDQFAEFARDASIDDDGKRRYLHNRYKQRRSDERVEGDEREIGSRSRRGADVERRTDKSERRRKPEDKRRGRPENLGDSEREESED